MPIYAVQYTYDPDRGDDRDRVRPEHREFLQSLADAGTILLRGPYSDDLPPGALIVVTAENAAAALVALDPDPFHREGFIMARTSREWAPVGDHPFR